MGLKLEVQEVGDVPDHGGQLEDRVVLVRGEVELERHVKRGSEFRVALEFVPDVVQQVVGLDCQLVVVLFELLVGVLLGVQLVF